MVKNIGLVDRILRVLAALLIVVLYLNDIIAGTLAIVLLIIAAVFVLTSTLSFCPLYVPLKMSTNKKSE